MGLFFLGHFCVHFFKYLLNIKRKMDIKRRLKYHTFQTFEKQTPNNLRAIYVLYVLIRLLVRLFYIYMHNINDSSKCILLNRPSIQKCMMHKVVLTVLHLKNRRMIKLTLCPFKSLNKIDHPQIPGHLCYSSQYKNKLNSGIGRALFMQEMINFR